MDNIVSSLGNEQIHSVLKDNYLLTSDQRLLHSIPNEKERKKRIRSKASAQTNSRGYCNAYAIASEISDAMEISKISVVGRLGVVYESSIRTNLATIDDSSKANKPFEEEAKNLIRVRKELLKFISEETTIIIGHSLFRVLTVLKLIPQNIIDICSIFPHDDGLPNRRTIESIAKECLGKDLTISECMENAKVCFEIMMWKIGYDLDQKKFTIYTLLPFNTKEEKTKENIPPCTSGSGPPKFRCENIPKLPVGRHDRKRTQVAHRGKMVPPQFPDNPERMVPIPISSLNTFQHPYLGYPLHPPVYHIHSTPLFGMPNSSLYSNPTFCMNPTSGIQASGSYTEVECYLSANPTFNTQNSTYEIHKLKSSSTTNTYQYSYSTSFINIPINGFQLSVPFRVPESYQGANPTFITPNSTYGIHISESSIAQYTYQYSYPPFFSNIPINSLKLSGPFGAAESLKLANPILNIPNTAHGIHASVALSGQNTYQFANPIFHINNPTNGIQPRPFCEMESYQHENPIFNIPNSTDGIHASLTSCGTNTYQNSNSTFHINNPTRGDQASLPPCQELSSQHSNPTVLSKNPINGIQTFLPSTETESFQNSKPTLKRNNSIKGNHASLPCSKTESSGHSNPTVHKNSRRIGVHTSSSTSEPNISNHTNLNYKIDKLANRIFSSLPITEAMCSQDAILNYNLDNPINDMSLPFREPIRSQYSKRNFYVHNPAERILESLHSSEPNSPKGSDKTFDINDHANNIQTSLHYNETNSLQNTNLGSINNNLPSTIFESLRSTEPNSSEHSNTTFKMNGSENSIHESLPSSEQNSSEYSNPNVNTNNPENTIISCLPSSEPKCLEHSNPNDIINNAANSFLATSFEPNCPKYSKPTFNMNDSENSNLASLLSSESSSPENVKPRYKMNGSKDSILAPIPSIEPSSPEHSKPTFNVNGSENSILTSRPSSEPNSPKYVKPTYKIYGSENSILASIPSSEPNSPKYSKPKYKMNGSKNNILASIPSSKPNSPKYVKPTYKIYGSENSILPSIPSSDPHKHTYQRVINHNPPKYIFPTLPSIMPKSSEHSRVTLRDLKRLQRGFSHCYFLASQTALNIESQRST